MEGASLHSLARKKFPKDTALSPNWTDSAMDGVKLSGRRGCRSGVRMPESDKDCAGSWDIISMRDELFQIETI